MILLMAEIDVQLVQGPVNADDACPPVPDGCGGECIFLGRTRSETNDVHGGLIALEYDAYGPMAAGEIARLAREAAEACDCSYIGVRHSIGRVAVGEASVLVRVHAGHRDQAFRACRRVIDELKASAPIWKRECWEDGSTWQDGTPVPAGEDNG